MHVLVVPYIRLENVQSNFICFYLLAKCQGQAIWAAAGGLKQATLFVQHCVKKQFEAPMAYE